MTIQTWFPDFVAAVEHILGEPISNFDYVEVIEEDNRIIEHRLMEAMPVVRIAFDCHDTPDEIADDLIATRDNIRADDDGTAYMVIDGEPDDLDEEDDDD